MGYRASVSVDPLSRTAEVRLIREGYPLQAAAEGVGEDGIVFFTEADEGVMVPPFLRLPSDALNALRDAFNDHAPPSDDADLREALSVERGRVDKVISAYIGENL